MEEQRFREQVEAPGRRIVWGRRPAEIRLAIVAGAVGTRELLAFVASTDAADNNLACGTEMLFRTIKSEIRVRFAFPSSPALAHIMQIDDVPGRTYYTEVVYSRFTLMDAKLELSDNPPFTDNPPV